jgi:hypothetical protein
MTPAPTASQASAFYLTGFRRALERYRNFVLTGWAITGLGVAGLFASCRSIEQGDLLATSIPLAAMTAGVLLVLQSIAALQAYVTTPFPLPDADDMPDGLLYQAMKSREMMVDVAEGGWQEAFEALAKLQTMQKEERRMGN